MDIKQFFAALLPNFERSQLVADVAAHQHEIEQVLRPALKNAEKVMRNAPFKSNAAVAFEKLFQSRFPNLARRPYFTAADMIFDTVGENLTYMAGQIPDMFAKEITKETLTYRKAAVLQMLDLSRFASEYASRHLNYLLECETQARVGGEITDRYVKPELDYLNNNLIAFLDALRVLYVPKREFVTLLENIPEITVDPKRVDVVRNTVGVRKLDPFKMGLIAARFNPIYKLRMYHAEYQVARYKRAKEEKRMLELRVLALKEALEGKKDARLQQQLDYNAGRLQTLTYEIQKMEEKYS